MDARCRFGKTAGEMGGLVFRGDGRYTNMMAFYGDRLEELTLNRPLKASGKIALHRGVSDSDVLFGFFHSEHSLNSGGSDRIGRMGATRSESHSRTLGRCNCQRRHQRKGRARSARCASDAGLRQRLPALHHDGRARGGHPARRSRQHARRVRFAGDRPARAALSFMPTSHSRVFRIRNGRQRSPPCA